MNLATRPNNGGEISPRKVILPPEGKRTSGQRRVEGRTKHTTTRACPLGNFRFKVTVMRRLPHWTLILSLALFAGGCAHTQPAAQIVQDGGLFNKFKPAASTTVVGQVDYVDPDASLASAILELNRQPFAMGTFLVVRDANQAPTAVLETTKQSSHNFQAVVIVAGKVSENADVVEPGPELARLVQENIDSYIVAHPEAAATKPAEPITPAVTPPSAVDPSAPTASPAPAPAADTATAK
jgi:hypothetical protein